MSLNSNQDDFELKDISEISAELDNFIQSEDSGILQSFFDRYVSKLIFKLKHFIFIGGMLLYIFNCHQLSSIELETHDPSVLKPSNPLQRGYNWFKNELFQDSTISIDFFWGLNPKLLHNPGQS